MQPYEQTAICCYLIRLQPLRRQHESERLVSSYVAVFLRQITQEIVMLGTRCWLFKGLPTSLLCCLRGDAKDNNVLLGRLFGRLKHVPFKIENSAVSGTRCSNLDMPLEQHFSIFHASQVVLKGHYTLRTLSRLLENCRKNLVFMLQV